MYVKCLAWSLADICPPTHPLIYSSIHPLNHSLKHPFIYPFIHPFIHPSLTYYPSIYLFNWLLFIPHPPLIHSFMFSHPFYSFIHPNYSIILPPVHLSNYLSIIHPSTFSHLIIYVATQTTLSSSQSSHLFFHSLTHLFSERILSTVWLTAVPGGTRPQRRTEPLPWWGDTH